MWETTAAESDHLKASQTLAKYWLQTQWARKKTQYPVFNKYSPESLLITVLNCIQHQWLHLNSLFVVEILSSQSRIKDEVWCYFLNFACAECCYLVFYRCACDGYLIKKDMFFNNWQSLQGKKLLINIKKTPAHCHGFLDPCRQWRNLFSPFPATPF